MDTAAQLPLFVSLSRSLPLAEIIYLSIRKCCSGKGKSPFYDKDWLADEVLWLSDAGPRLERMTVAGRCVKQRHASASYSV